MNFPPMRLSTGVPGLDEILLGGLIPGRAYLVRGGPGVGKTILGMHFLSSGIAAGEKTLFIAMGEPESNVRQNAESLGFDLGEVEFLDLSPGSDSFSEDQTYDIFPPSEVEAAPIHSQIRERVAAVRPARVVLDSVTQFRYLAPDAYQFRRQVVSFLRFLIENGATVLLTSESQEVADEDLQFISDGIIELESANGQRHVRIVKIRGSGFVSGSHFFRLTGSGMDVYPRLVPDRYQKQFIAESIPSGIPELDEMLHGGFERGTISLLTGPSGVGKTTVGMQFMKEAARRGERSVIYLFEEWSETLLRRCEAVKIPVREMIDAGTLSLVQIEPLRFSADEIARMVRQEVEEKNTRIIMLDSVAGYKLSISGGDAVPHLHALTKFMQNMGVTVLLANETEYITGDFRVSELGLSYLADSILFLRYLEIRGEMRKALGVLKKRTSDFQKTLRELEISDNGIRVGRELVELRGILSGSPEWRDGPDTGPLPVVAAQ